MLYFDNADTKYTSLKLCYHLTHWGRVTHICVGNLTTIGSDNGLSPDRRQDITWTNTGMLLIGPQVTIFSEILIEIYTFSFKKTDLKISSGKWRPFCIGLNVLKAMFLACIQHTYANLAFVYGCHGFQSIPTHRSIVWFHYHGFICTKTRTTTARA